MPLIYWPCFDHCFDCFDTSFDSFDRMPALCRASLRTVSLRFVLILEYLLIYWPCLATRPVLSVPPLWICLVGPEGPDRSEQFDLPCRPWGAWQVEHHLAGGASKNSHWRAGSPGKAVKARQIIQDSQSRQGNQTRQADKTISQDKAGRQGSQAGRCDGRCCCWSVLSVLVCGRCGFWHLEGFTCSQKEAWWTRLARWHGWVACCPWTRWVVGGTWAWWGWYPVLGDGGYRAWVINGSRNGPVFDTFWDKKCLKSSYKCVKTWS